MASVARSNVDIDADDFEIVELQSPEPNAAIITSSCGSPFCQLSHVSLEVERASERAIEPLIDIMGATAKSLQTKGPIFHASISETNQNICFEAFLDGLPAERRKVMNCSACEKFLRQYGNLCVVADDGSLIPLSWPTDLTDVPKYYKRSVKNILKLFGSKEVGREFMIRSAKGCILGKPTTNGWNHISIELSGLPIVRLNNSMNSQDTKTSFEMLDRILHENTAKDIARAHHLLLYEELPYATSHKPAIKYLQETYSNLAGEMIKDEVKRKNLVTRYSREAFPGCLSSLRGGMIGYLLECIREGQDFDTLKKNWQNKADPLSYMRPTAAPSAGNVESAEKIFANLGFTPRDLERVYLTLDQVPVSGILWSPNTAGNDVASVMSGVTLVDEPKPTKLFSSVLPAKLKFFSSQPDYTKAPIQDITFHRLALEILPNATTMAVLPKKTIQPFFFTTGKENTKPIMSFHNPDSHTASWYTWGAWSGCKSANMKEAWTPVTSVVSFPHMWDEFAAASDALDNKKAELFKHKRHGIYFLFCVQGAKEASDLRELGLFPTLMRSEFHSVRKTIEAFSQKGSIEAPPKGKEHVVGFAVKDKGKEGLIIGVKTKTGQVSRYRIGLPWLQSSTSKAIQKPKRKDPIAALFAKSPAREPKLENPLDQHKLTCPGI